MHYLCRVAQKEGQKKKKTPPKGCSQSKRGARILAEKTQAKRVERIEIFPLIVLPESFQEVVQGAAQKSVARRKESSLKREKRRTKGFFSIQINPFIEMLIRLLECKQTTRKVILRSCRI